MELQHDSTIQEQPTLLPSDLGWREHPRVCCSSLLSTETWVCSFLCRYYPAIENLRRLEHLHVQNHAVASETKNPNELLRQFLVVVRVLSIFSRFSNQENTCRHYRRQDWIKSNSSDSIVSVVSTREFPQCLMLLRVFLNACRTNSPSQRFVKSHLGHAKTHPRDGLPLDIIIQEQDLFLHVGSTCISIPY